MIETACPVAQLPLVSAIDSHRKQPIYVPQIAHIDMPSGLFP